MIWSDRGCGECMWFGFIGIMSALLVSGCGSGGSSEPLGDGTVSPVIASPDIEKESPDIEKESPEIDMPAFPVQSSLEAYMDYLKEVVLINEGTHSQLDEMRISINSSKDIGRKVGGGDIISFDMSSDHIATGGIVVSFKKANESGFKYAKKYDVSVEAADTNQSVVAQVPKELNNRDLLVFTLESDVEYSNGLIMNMVDPRGVLPKKLILGSTVNGSNSRARVLTVYGRNMFLAQEQLEKVRLVDQAGDTVYEIPKEEFNVISESILQLSIEGDLPEGDLSLQISFDGRSWLTFEGGDIHVVHENIDDDYTRPQEFGCAPSDGIDDTGCIVNAISVSQGSTNKVYLSRGVWEIGDAGVMHFGPDHGVVIPKGVSIYGEEGSTDVIRGLDYTTENGALFTILGNNTVSGINFRGDAKVKRFCAIKLGEKPNLSFEFEAKSVSGVSILNNYFDNTYYGLCDSSIPIVDLTVRDNTFEVYRDSIAFIGDPKFWRYGFSVRNTLIVENTFVPGGFVDDFDENSVPHQGPIGMQVGGSWGLVVVGNVFDGRRNSGWRGGVFFHMINNHEHLYISDNSFYCTGSAGGDGEAIALDDNGNEMAYRQVVAVDEATVKSVTVSSERLQKEKGYYLGYWVHVVRGRGVGQSRKIISYEEEGKQTITVGRAWNIVPDATSKIVLMKAFVDVSLDSNLISNEVCPQRPPLGKSGSIASTGVLLDTIIVGNEFRQSDGITLITAFSSKAEVPFSTMVNHSIIQENNFKIEYDRPNSTNGGLALWYGIDPEDKGAVFPIQHYDVSLMGNIIEASDGLRGGAVSTVRSWGGSDDVGLIENLVVQRNIIKNVPLGIRLDSPSVVSPYVVNNDFVGVDQVIEDLAKDTKSTIP